MLSWTAPASSAVLGYNVYRNSAVIAEMVIETSYGDEDLQNGDYSYYVTAVYETGESEPSNTVDVQVTGVGTENNELPNQVNIYPNPTGNILNIDAKVEISDVRLMNFAGQMVYTFNGHCSGLKINTREIPTGLYLLIIGTRNGKITRKVSIQ